MKIAPLVILSLLVAGCGPSGFSVNDPLDYIQPRPTAPYVSVVAPTGSMEPEIHSGAVISVQPVDIHDVREGDVVVIWWEARQIPVIHKVIRILVAANGEIGLITKGTHNQFPDRSASGLEHITTKNDLIGAATVIRK